MAVLDAVTSEPLTLAQLVDRTGLPRATAHRLAIALERHRLVWRDHEGRYVVGRACGRARRRAPRLPARPARPRCSRRCATAAARARSSTAARAVERVCVAVAERTHGLRTTVPVGARLPLTAGSGAQVLVAWWDDVAAVAEVLAQRGVHRPHAGRGAPAGVGAVGRAAGTRRGVGVRAGAWPGRCGRRGAVDLRPHRTSRPVARGPVRAGARRRGRPPAHLTPPLSPPRLTAPAGPPAGRCRRPAPRRRRARTRASRRTPGPGRWPRTPTARRAPSRSPP